MACPEFNEEDRRVLRLCTRSFYLVAAVFPDLNVEDRIGAISVTKDFWKNKNTVEGTIPIRSHQAFAWSFKLALDCVKGLVTPENIFENYQSAFGLSVEDVEWQPYSPISKMKP